MHVRELRLLKMGEKTAAANAMVAGLGPTVKIYVSDTLAEPEEGEDEGGALARTRVVLAHELGHHVHHDLWRLLTMSVATLGVGIAGAWAAIEAFAPHGAGHLSTLPAAVLGSRWHRPWSRRPRPPTRAAASGPPTPTRRRSPARGRRLPARWNGSSRAT